MKRRVIVGAALLVALGAQGPATGQPVPMPEVVAESPAIRPPVSPAGPDGVSTSSARRPPASAASEALVGQLDRTG